MWWLIGGASCVGLTILLVVAFFGYVALERRWEAKLQATLDADGTLFKAYVVFANDNLYLMNPMTNMWPAQVVFTLDKDLDDRDEFLADLAKRLKTFKAKNVNDHDERVIGQVIRTKYGYRAPLRIPDRVTRGVEAYTVTIDVDCALLPKRKLTKPYLYCRVIVDPALYSRKVARMRPYPKKKVATSDD